jgi:hypothetical protein
MDCPTREIRAFCKESLEKAKKSREQPGLPSGVSSQARNFSIPASVSQPMTEEACPVAVIAAF